jgi:anti-anti-sigma factor
LRGWWTDSPGSVAVDLTEVTFLDSTGLRALLRTRPAGAFIVLVTENGPVRILLDQTEVLELFKVVDRLGDDRGQLTPPDEAPHTTEVDLP